MENIVLIAYKLNSVLWKFLGELKPSPSSVIGMVLLPNFPEALFLFKIEVSVLRMNS